MSRSERTYLVRSSDVFKLVFGIFAVTSVILVLCQGFFAAETFINSPQSVRSIDQISSATGWKLYYTFFAFDFIWLLTFLLIGLSIYHAYKGAEKDDRSNDASASSFNLTTNTRQWEMLPILVASLALGADYLENISFLTFKFSFVKTIQPIKIALVVLFIAFFPFFQFFKGYIIKFSAQLGLFVRSSYLSLIIILVVTFLLSKLDQGVALLAGLCEEPISLVFTYLLILHLAHVVSHYPLYFLPGRVFNKYYELERSKLIGLTTYFYKPKENRAKWHQLKYPVFNMLRRSLGVLLYAGWTYVLFSAWLKFWDFEADPMVLTAVLFFFIFQFYWVQEQRKIKWKVLRAEREMNSENEAALSKIKRQLKIRFLSLAALSLISLLLTALVAGSNGWSETTLFMMLVSSVIHALFFALFKVARTTFWEEELENTEQGISRGKRLVLGLLHRVADNKQYLNALVFISKLLLVVLLVLNFISSTSIKITAIIIVIMYLVGYYDLIALVIKRLRVHNERLNVSSKVKMEPSRFWKIYFPFAALLFLLFVFVVNGQIIANRLNDLDLIEEKIEHRGIENAQSYFDTFDSDSPMLISADGGGVRASFWTMLILVQLDSLTNGQMFRNTLSYSGASGGGIGQALYFAMHDVWSAERIPAIISQIGYYNFLSSDLTFWLGRDLIYGAIPCGNYNRSDALIDNYLDLICEKDTQQIARLKKRTFRATWNTIDRKKGNVPLLIVNTARSETGQRAIASPFTAEQTTQLFPGTVNILDFPDNRQTLTFFEAVFTTNRFPFYAPAAKIPGKGHFLDGGYYDNSGLTSTFDLLESWNQTKAMTVQAPRDSSTSIRPLPYLINIHNDKYWYAYSLIQENEALHQLVKTSHRTQLSSVFGGALGPSLMGIPRYWMEQMDDIKAGNNNDPQIRGYFDIYLPHLLSITDIEKVIGGTIEKLEKQIMVKQLLKQHNDTLKRRLANNKSGSKNREFFIDPPLGRYLPETVVEYMKTCVKTDPVKTKLDEIRRLFPTQ